MTVYECCRYDPIDYTGVPRMVRKDIVCFHTGVGHDPFRAAHVSMGSRGELTQNRDTEYQSAANLDGNPYIVAVESEDIGPEFGDWDTDDGHAVPAWTDEECEAAARFLAEAHRKDGIPLELVPDSKPGRRGVAYHRMGCDGDYRGYAYGGRVEGGVRWSSKRGKVCPGDRRIWQLIHIVIPRARVLAGLDPAPVVVLPPEEVSDMERILVVWGKKPGDPPSYASLCGLVMPGPDGRVFEDVSGKSKARADADRNVKRTDVGRWDEITVEADVWDRYKARFEPAGGGA